MIEHPQQRRANSCDKPHDVLCQQAEEAADRSAKKVFAILGVDINDPKQVEEFREDLRFGKHLRRAAGYGVLAMVATVAAAIMGAFWYSIKAVLGIPS